MVEKLRLITGWECGYCDKRVIEQGNDYLTNYFSKKEEHFFLVKKHLDECQEAQNVINEIDSKKDNELIYDDECLLRKKGYITILELNDSNLGASRPWLTRV